MTVNRNLYPFNPDPPFYLAPVVPTWVITAVDDLRKQVNQSRRDAPGMKPMAYALVARGYSVFMEWPLVQTLSDVIWEQSSISVDATVHVRISIKKHLESVALPPSQNDVEELGFAIDKELGDSLKKTTSAIGLAGQKQPGKGHNPLSALCIQIALAEDPGEYNKQGRERIRAHVEDVRQRWTVEAESARVLLDYWRSHGPI